MIGCSVQTKQNKEQENIVKRDTAYVIEPFLRDGITYICKDEVTKRVYFIGNERMLIAHDSNRLRFS